ncbi:baseplate J/gp47 family protein [Anabaena azotica]|uniref:Baseplate J/gp47 family protein n=1 Tax=Anabaena azotica FACHB-119 TaxID=947527 RepID=A0ABR8D9C4_9NOST|nr:baseplate J/gp47 family protein [Anabaena azotica]MBD2503800.1 baseplate J/gp47 family protein [Anabaena azotica FACHB-119]
MPIELPNLDDRTYDDLVQEALSLIPSYAPDWTNYNPSDPGITLIELFAYLSEMLIYRLNRVTDTNQYAFLKLLNGPDWQPSPQKTLNEEIRETVLKLRKSERAVTCQDFENLTLAASPQIARVRCIPRRNLVSENPLQPEERPGQISIVIVPHPPGETLKPVSMEDLIKTVIKYLEPRRLLTTKVNVVAPRYVEVGVRMTLHLKRDVKEADVRDKAIATARKFLHPLTGGAESLGWPFGRHVYVSEIYELLDKLKGIDFVTPTNDQEELTVSNSNRILRDKGKLVAIKIQPEELVTPGNIELKFESPIKPK